MGCGASVDEKDAPGDTGAPMKSFVDLIEDEEYDEVVERLLDPVASKKLSITDYLALLDLKDNPDGMISFRDAVVVHVTAADIDLDASDILELMSSKTAQLAIQSEGVRQKIVDFASKLFDNQAFVHELLKLDKDLVGLDRDACQVKVAHKILSNDAFVGELMNLVAGYDEKEPKGGVHPLEEFYEIITTQTTATCEAADLDTLVESPGADILEVLSRYLDLETLAALMDKKDYAEVLKRLMADPGQYLSPEDATAMLEYSSDNLGVIRQAILDQAKTADEDMVEAALSNFLEYSTGEDGQSALAQEEVRTPLVELATKFFNDEGFILKLLELDDDLDNLQGTDCRVKVTHGILSNDNFVGELLELVAGYDEQEQEEGTQTMHPLEKFNDIITTDTPIEACEGTTLEDIVDALTGGTLALKDGSVGDSILDVLSDQLIM